MASHKYSGIINGYYPISRTSLNDTNV